MTIHGGVWNKAQGIPALGCNADEEGVEWVRYTLGLLKRGTKRLLMVAPFYIHMYAYFQ